MKALHRNKTTLLSRSNLRYAHSSAIRITKTETTPPQSHILACKTATHLPKLHELLQSCAKTKAPIEAQALHAQLIRIGFQRDTLTSNMLINAYSKCGLVECARKVFDEMHERSIVSWNTVLGMYTRCGEEREALGLFVEILRGGVEFSEFTVSSVLCACAAECGVFECRQLHGVAVKRGMDSNVFVGTALLDVYGKSGLVKDGFRVFEGMSERSDVTWSSMVAGFVQNGLYEEGLGLFSRGRVMGLELNEFMVSAAVSACAGIAALVEGRQLHAGLLKAGLDSNMFVVCSLIDLYAKCGCVVEAYSVFSNVREKSVVLWNAMISGFAKNACSVEVMILFEKMQQMGVFPNDVTYVSVLSACSHMGLVERGRKYFDLMVKEQNVSPSAFHYSCMVDILGRAGLIHEAHELIKRMPFDATAAIWGSLLASCRNYGNLGLAEVAAKNLFKMEPENAGNHVLLSNIYAANKKWEEVAKIRMLLKESEAKKERGKSWIQIKDKVHTFMVGERNHPRIAEVYMELDSLLKKMDNDYRVEAKHDLHDVDESRKLELLRHHSEKLALAFALLSLPPSAPIRIMKNLRICGDCHSFMKLVSSITGREIIVRDTNRFHHFRKGSCSCGDFW